MEDLFDPGNHEIHEAHENEDAQQSFPEPLCQPRLTALVCCVPALRPFVFFVYFVVLLRIALRDLTTT